MTNREATFLVLFIVSLGINIYFLILQTDDEKEKGEYFPVHCDDVRRYDESGPNGGISISNDVAKESILRYRDAHPEENREFVFSKAAVDRLFDLDASANVLHVALGYEDDKTICILNARRDEMTNLTFRSGHKFIKSESGCPSICLEL